MYSYPSNYNKNFNPSGLPYSVMLSETLDFQTRMTAAGGNLLSDNELNAINYWISQYKYYNLWDKMTAYYPLVGGNGGAGSLASFTINLKSSSYTLLNAGGVLNIMCDATGFKNTGSTANGSTVIWNTGISDLNFLDRNNKGMSCYIRSNEIKSNIYDMGCYTSTYANMTILSAYVNSSTNCDMISGNAIASDPETVRTLTTPLPLQGFYSMARYNQEITGFKNGRCLGKKTFAPIAGTNQNIYFNCGMRDTALSTDVSNRSYGSFSVHQAYTIAEEKQRAIIEQNFQNLLGRAVSIS